MTSYITRVWLEDRDLSLYLFFYEGISRKGFHYLLSFLTAFQFIIDSILLPGACSNKNLTFRTVGFSPAVFPGSTGAFF